MWWVRNLARYTGNMSGSTMLEHIHSRAGSLGNLASMISSLVVAIGKKRRWISRSVH